MYSELLGKTVGKYSITSLIGKGGMGAVYEARDPDLERTVALKVMDPTLGRDDGFMKRFRIEAKALAHLDHPHIVRVYALQDTEIGVCIVMEYVRGMTLADIIRDSGALGTKRALLLFRQILSAFEYAHNAGVIHRDIKPSNIMVTDSNEIKVTDFGLAKIHRHSGSTMTQLTGGTLYYISPEQLEGLANVDHRGDIYSIGMTLYEALTGTVPFEKTESDFRIRERIVHGKIPSPRSFNPSISKRLNDLVMKAIARDPASRFQSVADMHLVLKQVEMEEMEKVGGQAPKQNHRKAIIVGIAVVVVAIVSFYMYKRSLLSYAVMTIRTTPSEAHVRVNDVDVGLTPIQELRVPQGKVRVKVEKPNYTVIDTQFSIKSDDHFVTTLALTSQTGNTQSGRSAMSEIKTGTGQPPIQGRDEKLASKADVQNDLTERRMSGKTSRTSDETRPDKKNLRAGKADNLKVAPPGDGGPSGEETNAEKLEADRAALEKFEKEKRAAEESARVKRGLQNLVDRYRNAFEVADLASLKSLLRFSDKDEQAWSRFFEVAKEIKVSVEDLDMQNNPDRAEVAFKATLSYVNNKGEQASTTIRNSWRCENIGGKWVIVTHK